MAEYVLSIRREVTIKEKKELVIEHDIYWQILNICWVASLLFLHAGYFVMTFNRV